MIYVCIFIILILLSFQYDYLKRNQGSDVLYWIMVFILILLAGLRYRLGIDSIRYEEYQLFQPSLDQLSQSDLLLSRFGFGWTILASFAKTLSPEFICLQLVQSIYVNILFGFFIKRYSKHIFLGLLIYFLFLYTEFMFEVLREACAVATYLLAWKYILKRNWIKYYIICFISILFHISAVITLFVPIAFIPGITTWFKINKRLGIILLVILFVGFYLSVLLFEYIATLSLVDSIQERAATYAQHENYSGGRQASILGLLCIIINRVIYPSIAFFSLKNEKQFINRQIEVLTIFFMFFSIISIPIMLFNRFTNYFSPFVIILISNWIYNTVHWKNIIYKCKFTSWLIILFPYFFIQLYGYFKEDGNSGVMRYRRYSPYSSILTKKIDKDREKLQNFYTI